LYKKSKQIFYVEKLFLTIMPFTRKSKKIF